MIVKCPICKNEIATNAPGRLTRDIEAALATKVAAARQEAFKEAITIANVDIEAAGAYNVGSRRGALAAQRQIVAALERAAATDKEK